MLLEWGQRAPYLVLRVSADPAARGEGQPVAGAEAERDSAGQDQRAGQGRTGAQEKQTEHRRRRAREPEAAGAGQAALLLATRVLHGADSPAERVDPVHPPMLPPPEDATPTGTTGLEPGSMRPK